MNAPGSPSSPLQMTYLVASARCPNDTPFRPGREPGAATSAQSTPGDLVDHLVGLEFHQAPTQRPEAVVTEVLLQVQRVEVAEMLRRHVDLPPQKGARRTGFHVHRAPRGRAVVLFQQDAVDGANRGPRHPAPEIGRLKVLHHQLPGLIGFHRGVEPEARPG